jgi:hypothetical protein
VIQPGKQRNESGFCVIAVRYQKDRDLRKCVFGSIQQTDSIARPRAKYQASRVDNNPIRRTILIGTWYYTERTTFTRLAYRKKHSNSCHNTQSSPNMTIPEPSGETAERSVGGMTGDPATCTSKRPELPFRKRWCFGPQISQPCGSLGAPQYLVSAKRGVFIPHSCGRADSSLYLAP